MDQLRGNNKMPLRVDLDLFLMLWPRGRRCLSKQGLGGTSHCTPSVHTSEEAWRTEVLRSGKCYLGVFLLLLIFGDYFSFLSQ